MGIKIVRKGKSTLLNDTDTVLNSTAIITKQAFFYAVSDISDAKLNKLQISQLSFLDKRHF